MPAAHAEHRRVVVLGGGISGLAAAHRLVELAPGVEVVVLEAQARPGGLLGTVTHDVPGVGTFVVETGPDAILTEKTAAIALAERIGLGPEIIRTSERNRGAYVVSRGKLERIPEGFQLLAPTDWGELLGSSILSMSGKARAALELVLPRGGGGEDADESLASFVERRYGREMLERLAQPMASGIYGADPARLSLRATMPRFLDEETRSRSVSLGLRKRALAAREAKASGVRYSLFISFRGGMQAFVDRLVTVLDDRLRTGARVEGLACTGRGKMRVTLAGGEVLEADGVISALPPRALGALVSPLDAALGSTLGAFPLGSSSTVTFGFRERDIPHALDAFGFVVPSSEGRRVLASTWASVKWEGRAPAGHALLRVFLGGHGSEDVLTHDDDALVRIARRELRELMGIEAAPLFSRVARYLDAMPQYHVGHLERAARIEETIEALGPLAVAGNFLWGVGIPDAVRIGEGAAEKILKRIGLAAPQSVSGQPPRVVG